MTTNEEIEEFSFSAFANAPFYRKINTDLVDLSGVAPGHRVIDLACGTGGVTKIISEKLRGAKESLVIGVDMSSSALKQARFDIASVGGVMVEFVMSRAELLSRIVRDNVDAVVFCNAIHLVTDKSRLSADIFSTLRSGGIFAFNTSFYDGGHPPETLWWYRKWMMRSLRILRSEYSMSPVKSQKVEARQHISTEDYKLILEQNGFEIRKQRINTVQVPLDGWVLISQFRDWITGVMPGVPLKEASFALQKGAAQIFEEMDLKFITRNWLEVVAVRP